MNPRERFRGGDPVPVGDVLARYFRTSGLKQKLRSPEVYDCWPEVAGSEASKHSRVIGFSNCVLYVEVDSAPWLQRLAAFRKQELLRALQDVLRGACVKDIKFRIGRGAGASAAESGRKPCRTQPQRPPTMPGTSRSCPA